MKVLESAGADGKQKRVKITIWDTGTTSRRYLSSFFCRPPKVETFSYQPVRRDFARSLARTIEGLKESYSASRSISPPQFINFADGNVTDCYLGSV